MNHNTAKVRNHCFTTPRGNRVEVFNLKQVATNGMFKGHAEVVRTFAEVCGTTVELEVGCAFQAPSRVAAAGF